MDCSDLEAMLTDFLEGLLAPAVEAAAVEHVATCQRCEAVLTGTRAVMAAAADVGRLPLEADDRDRLLGDILAVLDPAYEGSGERKRRAHRRVRGDDHE